MSDNKAKVDSTFGNEQMMGSIVRRRRVVSMPFGDSTFFTPTMGAINEDEVAAVATRRERRAKQESHPPPRDMVSGILRRKQVSLDLLSPQAAAFFDINEEEEEEPAEEENMPNMFFPLRFAPRQGGGRGGHGQGGDEEAAAAAVEPPPIIHAKKKDKIMALVLAAIMMAFVAVCVAWETHEDESHTVFGLVGTACITPCLGDRDYRNFFIGHEDHFHNADVLELTMHMDPHPLTEGGAEDYATVEIARLDQDEFGSTNQTVVHTVTFGPADEHERKTFKEKFSVEWDDSDRHHVINVKRGEAGVPLSFTLAAQKQSGLSKYSVLIAALIMVLVYVFILLEVIHRTLVSIFGSMIALFFFFLMHNGETESIRTIMLHQEWSTLGLLFGMMVIVGELSHTGIFEWLAVRLLVSSKGSFNRLMVLLCLLTAVASAFLDNVTTMLLLAPVTIDMCGILGVDPRPYLIAEVILSNIGGTVSLMILRFSALTY
jgi:hypothetical protein